MTVQLAPSGKISPSDKWKPPDVDLLKINTNAAIDSLHQVVGLEEAIAVLRDIFFAYDLGIVPNFIESDASTVVDLINGRIMSSADVEIVVLRCFLGSVVSLVPRLANFVAHSIAKLALVSTLDLFLVNDFPFFVESCILTDLPG
ncbi:hypothetical protein ACOSQ4_018167 [Xanthoceras sorbifolium]